jgi:hypothetical protein
MLIYICVYIHTGKTASKRAWSKRAKRRILVLGWNERGEKTIKEIATVCPKGSEIVTLNGKPEM